MTQQEAADKCAKITDDRTQCNAIRTLLNVTHKEKNQFEQTGWMNDLNDSLI